MKEPKYVKYEEDSKDNQGKRYNFFEEGLFPEKEDEKKIKNKSSQKKQQKYPFSIPEQEKKRISNTQKEDLLPFFAKNYPSSSESKEEICFINTPAPSNSNSYSGGEAEEVEGIEEEDEKNEKSEEKKINNEDYGLSVDFNSEIEAEQERQSKTMTREEILSRIEEKKKKDEEEKRKKEEERKKKEEERKKKEEEEKWRKELEEKKKKKKEEKFLREQEIKRQKMIEEEKRTQKEEEEKRKRELSKKKREERKREQEKKLEEEKKKNNESGNKADKFNLLSSIKKNINDNSYIASNSIINEVKQIFPETIPEENDGEDDDFSKRNFKGSSKKKISNKNSKKENKNNDNKKSKKVSNFNDNLNKYKNNKRSQVIKNEENEEEEGEEEEEENTKKNLGRKTKKTKSQKSISSKVSKKSNGLGMEYYGREIIKKISEEDNVSELSNYGDELIDAEDKIKTNEEKEEYDSDSEPKKKKVKKNDKKKSKPKKRKNSKQKRSSKTKSEYTDRELELGRYNAMSNVKTYTFTPIEEEGKTFGNGRYSKRNRISTLNHLAGERAKYIYFNGVPTLKEVELVNRRAFSDDAFLREKVKNNKKKNRKLVKSSNLDDKLENISEENEYNSELLESQDISEYGDDDARFLKIPKGGKKSKAKNYDTLMIIRVHDAKGRNMIRIDNKEYKDLKTGDEVRVNQNQVFEILNFSDYHLIVQLLFDYEE